MNVLGSPQQVGLDLAQHTLSTREHTVRVTSHRWLSLQPNKCDNSKAPIMTSKKHQDQRLLSKDERDLIAGTRYPAMKELSDGALADLAMYLRKARDQVGLWGRFQRRELRGQMPVSGVTASRRGGSSARYTLLAAAVTRVNRQLEKRRVSIAPPTSKEKRASSRDHAIESETRRPSPVRPAIGDMQPVPSTDIPALRRRGITPILEGSRTRR